MADMPNTYAQQSTTTRTTSVGFPAINVNPDYVKSMPGMFKVVEIVLSLIVFICSVVRPSYSGDGWVDFVAMSAFLIILTEFIICLLGLRNNLPDISNLIIFIVYCVITVFFFISAIIAAVSGHWAASIAATAFFAFVCTAVFGADTFLQYRMWQEGDGAGVTMTTTTTTTTNHSNPTEVTAQY